MLPPLSLPVVRERVEALRDLHDPERILAGLRKPEALVVAAGGELPPRFAAPKASLTRLAAAVSEAKQLLTR